MRLSENFLNLLSKLAYLIWLPIPPKKVLVARYNTLMALFEKDTYYVVIVLGYRSNAKILGSINSFTLYFGILYN